MTRIPIVVLAAALALGACGTGPSQPYLFGLGDPLQGAALNAPWEFGRTADLAGDPVAGAAATFRMEQLARAADEEPLWQVNAPGTLQPQLRMARAQMRTALGITPDMPPAAAQSGLYRALTSLRAGDAAAVETALSAPGFTLGGAATLARLGALPRMRLVDETAQFTAQAFGPTGNGYFGRGGGS